jgi:hypothetical protein
MFMVGIDIEPGVYRAAVPTSSCVWWRLRGLEDNLDAVIANDATSWPAIVEIQPDDLAFESAGCGEWTSLEETPVTASPLADAPDGMYRVGTDLSPGVWTTAGGNPNCVWERRSGFGGTDDDAIEQAGSQWPQTVVLEPGDVGFASWNCGPWSFVAPTIGNVDPASAFVGDDVVISGTALQAVTGVSFNGTPATEFSVSPMGAVEAVVPTGATTGPVTVSTAGGDAVSPDNFTVLAGAPPVITSFGPPSGSVGDSVFINGANFTGTTAVAFNGVAATTFFVVSDSAISAAVPEGASTGPISVTTLVTTRSSTTSFTVAGPPVNQAPYASFISPAGATPVRGVVRLQVDAFDGETQVDRVEFFADGEPIGTATELDGELSWSIRWNSTGFADGQTHAVEAVAYDTEELGSVPAQLSLVVEPVTAMDFDGDGAADRSVFRPQYGGWFVDGGATEFLGLSGDVPVPGDYDGDGTTERAVFRDGAWFIEGEPTRFLGAPGDIPVPGDYDGDGVMEPAVFRDGAWYIEGQPTRYWGSPGDVPVPADYDGDGTSEAAVFRAEVGAWYVEDEATVFFGLESDVPVPGDYDGDGRTDRAVFRPQVGGWYVDGQLTEFIGLDSDVPVPADYDGDGIVERAVFRPQVGGWYVQDAVTVFYGLDTDVPLLLPAAIYNARY